MPKPIKTRKPRKLLKIWEAAIRRDEVFESRHFGTSELMALRLLADSCREYVAGLDEADRPELAGLDDPSAVIKACLPAINRGHGIGEDDEMTAVVTPHTVYH